MTRNRQRAKERTVPIGRRRSDDTSRQIVALIFEGNLAPGSRLPSERELAALFGVSRSTLRDALNRLEARGFIERRSKSGNYVCSALPSSLREPIEDIVEEEIVDLGKIIEIRKVLELWAVSRAVDTADRAALVSLRACLNDMRAAAGFRTPGQFATYSDADLRFHQTLAEMTNNPIYVHLIHFIAHLIGRSISVSRQIVPGDFAERNLRMHERIYRALQQRDGLKAREAMRDHFAFVETHLAQRLRARKAGKRDGPAKAGK